MGPGGRLVAKTTAATTKMTQELRGGLVPARSNPKAAGKRAKTDATWMALPDSDVATKSADGVTVTSTGKSALRRTV